MKNNKIIYIVLFTIFCVVIYFVFNFRNNNTVINKDNYIPQDKAIHISEILNKSDKKNITKILESEESLRFGIKNSITKMQEEIRGFCIKNKYVCSNLKTSKIRNKIVKDIKILSRINTIESNKMIWAMKFAINEIENIVYLSTLLAGKMPENIEIDWNSISFLGGVKDKDDRGTGKLLGLIVSLAYIGNELKNENNISIISFFDHVYRDISFVIPISDNSKYTFVKNNEMLLFKDSTNLSYISKILNIEENITTLNLLSIWSERNNFGHIEWDSESIKLREKLLKLIVPVNVLSINEIVAGMIVAERYFSLSKKNQNSAGFGGRSMIVIGVDYRSNEIFGISTSNQIYKGRSGLGIDIYEYKKTKDESCLQMFFKIVQDK